MSRPPRWLMVTLMGCVTVLLLFSLIRLDAQPLEVQAAAPLASPLPTEVSPSPTSTPAPTPASTPEPAPAPESTPAPTAEALPSEPPVAGATPTPLPTADPVQTAPPEGAADEDWFADAVFIGDSRTDGFRLYSGVTHADFLAVTGLNVYDVMNGKKVIRAGEEKVSILDALSQKQYGKVYISLGVNELGYHDPEGFTDTYGQIIDAVRALQPEAVLYIQSIIPVNAEKCLANSQPAYVTNEAIADYNAALSALCEEKQVPFLDLSQALADETGEVPAEDSADGIHFKRSGYVKWKDYLLAHTTP